MRKHSMVFPAATVALLLSFAPARVTAQTSKPKDEKGMKGMEGMHGISGKMGGPHHMLAMAYRDNLANFARTLRGQVNTSKTVNLDLARPATAEMRRSFDQMKEHHQAQMKTMSDQMNSATAETMKHMESHLTALNEHLTALESEVSATTPDSKKVSEHTSEILKLCTDMSTMPGKAKSHH